jgi:hypothetical protein
MEGLFIKTVDFDDDIYRNIVSLRVSDDLFDDLAEGDPELSELLASTEMRIKRENPPGIISRGFHYSTAIGYPFSTEPFMASRFGDGSFGVWYGSLEMDTTLYETAWHMMQDESGIEGLDEIVIRERAIYLVQGRAIFFDLTGRNEDFPQLVANDYAFTQQVGKRLQNEGHPGLFAASARCSPGTNVAVFNPQVLSHPKLFCYFSYQFDPGRQSIAIERERGEQYLLIEY